MATNQAPSGVLETPPITKPRSNFKEILTVLVGDELDPSTFNVHKDLICSTSTFFSAATSRDWIEAQEKTVRLSGLYPEHFHLYLEWLYGHSTELAGMTKRLGEAFLPDNGDPHIARANTVHFLAHAWLLGSYIGDCSFQNAIMASLLKMRIDHADEVHIETVGMVAKGCSTHSALYRWTVETIVHTSPAETVDLVGKAWPPEFWRESCKVLMRASGDFVERKKLPSRLEDYQELYPQEVKERDRARDPVSAEKAMAVRAE